VRDLGGEVYVMTRVNRLGEELQNKGFYLIPWHVSRGSLNPFRELLAFLQVLRAYRVIKPALVHHVALKPVILGGLSALVYRNVAIVNAITGFGHVFTARSYRMARLRGLLLAVLRRVLRRERSITIVQNQEDLEFLIQTGIIAPENAVVIKGAGVDCRKFKPSVPPDSVPLVLLASRMLWEKGVGDFVAAARMLRGQGVNARFVLVGAPDHANPASISETQLRLWADSGVVEWWGHQDDMPGVLVQASVICLPSYAEGLPRVLVEAAACGRPVVTTDVPGCRDVVRDGQNGFLVPPRDAQALARALGKLLMDASLRASMGERSRDIAVREFSEELVIGQTLAAYDRLLGFGWRKSIGMGPIN
jgi:glycosyltransferase involved in cell wall biosynthesis